MPFCELCWRGFGVGSNYSKHLASPVHARGNKFRCSECGRWFSTKCALNRHRRTSGSCETIPSVLEYHCRDCQLDFPSQKALKRHLDKENLHGPVIRHRCEDCNREFRTEGALGAHRSSIAHVSLVDEKIRCIGGRHCGRLFASASAMITHLESGACRPDITKERIGKAIIGNDPRGVPPNGSLLSDGGNSNNDSPLGSTFAAPIIPISAGPSSGGVESLLPSGILTHSSDDVPVLSSDPQFSNMLSCPLCPGRRNRFKTAAALQNHLESAGGHSPKIYRYPGRDALGKRFTTLGALAQHAERRALLEDDEAKRVLDDTVALVSEKLRQLTALGED